jgi:hypothetical protein
MGKALEMVISVLKTTPQRWLQFAETIPPELLKRAPAAKEWSAYECLQHMVDTERMVFPARVGHLLRGEDFPAFYPDTDGSKPQKALSPIDLAGEFEILRAKSITILSKVQAKDLSRKAKHQELGIVTLGEMINEWAGHDLMHTIQGERAMMQVFIEGCGPWKHYFTAHVIDK